MSLKPLWENHEIYQKSFQAFIDNSNVRRPAMLTFQKDGIRQALPKIMEKIDINEPFKVLGVGSGSGEIDLLFLQTLADSLVSRKKKTPILQNVIVEPSAFFLDQFKMKATSLPRLLEKTGTVTFEWHQKTFSEFNQESITEKNSFDLIHFVHSIYYLDPEDALQSCYEQWLKTENGAIICYVHTEESFHAKLSKTFPGKLSGASSDDIFFYTYQDLAAIAEKYGWKYYVPVKEQFEINVTTSLREPSPKDDMLIDFLTHQQNFRANAKQELFHSVMEMIESLAFTNESGEKVVKGENAAFIIYK